MNLTKSPTPSPSLQPLVRSANDRAASWAAPQPRPPRRRWLMAGALCAVGLLWLAIVAAQQRLPALAGTAAAPGLRAAPSTRPVPPPARQATAAAAPHVVPAPARAPAIPQASPVPRVDPVLQAPQDATQIELERSQPGGSC